MRHGAVLASLSMVVLGCGLPPAANNGNGGGSGAGGSSGAGSSGGGGSSAVSMCPNGGSTTLTGKVFAPNGTLPLYNAIVYVPGTAVAPFTNGVSCGACDGKVSGNPIAKALTGPDGTFTLTGVPSGASVPLVIQLGKWRTQLTVPVTACQNNAVNPAMTHWPRRASEGDMPLMAIATGSADPFECLLLKIGIDPAEIREPSANTRVQFYAGEHSHGTLISGNTPSGTQLYSSLNSLMRYDIVMLPCEGAEFDQSTAAGGQTLNPDPRGLLVQYVNMGGRIFTTHYSYDWLTYVGSPYNNISTDISLPLTNGLWDKDQTDRPNDSVTIVAQLVTSFPKGMAFAQWLLAAGAASAPNTLNIQQIRHDIDGVNMSLAQAWATDVMPADSKPGIAHLTFNTPLNPPVGIDNQPQYCGRVVYSDFHVAQSEANQSQPFPTACQGGALTDQEKALAFMLFDLSSCVLPDSQPPTPPIG